MTEQKAQEMLSLDKLKEHCERQWLGVYDELRAFDGEELIDALYDMIVYLKEEGVI